MFFLPSPAESKKKLCDFKGWDPELWMVCPLYLHLSPPGYIEIHSPPFSKTDLWIVSPAPLNFNPICPNFQGFDVDRCACLALWWLSEYEAATVKSLETHREKRKETDGLSRCIYVAKQFGWHFRKVWGDADVSFDIVPGKLSQQYCWCWWTQPIFIYTLSPKNIVSWIGPCPCEPSCTGWHLLNHRTICSNGTGLHPSISYCLKRGIHCVAKDHPPQKTIVQCSLGKGDLFCFSSFLCVWFSLCTLGIAIKIGLYTPFPSYILTKFIQHQAIAPIFCDP